MNRRKLFDLSGAAIAAAMVAGAIMRVIAGAVGSEVNGLVIYLISALSALSIAGAMYAGVWGYTASGVLGAGLICALFSPVRSLITHYAESGGLYSPAIALLGAAVLGAVMFALARTRGGVYPAAVICAFAVAAGSNLNPEFRALDILPALIGLAAMFAVAANGKSCVLRALIPCAVVVAITGALLTPGAGVTYPPFKAAADKVRVLFEDYFKFTHARMPYSIYMDGYQPMGEAMGGPASPQDTPVMRVTSTDALYLRGAIKKDYNLHAWTDASVKGRYLYFDPLRAGIRSEVFGQDIDAGNAFREISADIEFLSEGTSTLFLPYRLKNLSAPVELAVYYNTVGEAFLPRLAQPGDAYSITALVPASDQAMEEFLKTARGDGESAKIIAEYTLLPDGIDRRVYALVGEIIANADTDYSRAVAIRDYLRANYQYSLNVDYPTSDDFVSQFLLYAKRGYCSYFASAMAVMARIAGLPSRYVEGYLVIPDESGETVVTAASAHAWTEIYFDGAGWLTFDATPGDGERADNATDNRSSEPTPTPTPTPDSAPTPTPEPNLENGPTPTPDFSQAPGFDNTPTPEPQNGISEPEAPNPPDSPDSPDSEGDNNLNWLWWLFILPAVLALVAGLIYLLLARTDPRLRAKLIRDKRERMLVWYQAIIQVLASEGQFPDSQESPSAFAARMRKTGMCTDSFEAFAERLALSRYANAQPDAEAFRLAAQVYLELTKQLRFEERLRWLRRRLVSGLMRVQ